MTITFTKMSSQMRYNKKHEDTSLTTKVGFALLCLHRVAGATEFLLLGSLRMT